MKNSGPVRQAIVDGLSWFGLDIDESKNVVGADGIISIPNAKVKVLVIPTDEELVIARDVEKFKAKSLVINANFLDTNDVQGSFSCYQTQYTSFTND